MEKGQKTIEETLDGIEEDKDVEDQINGHDKPDGDNKVTDQEEDLKSREDAVAKREEAVSKKEQNGLKDNKKNAFDEVKADTGEVKEAAEKEQEEKSGQIADHNGSVIEDEKREAEVPSSILEKGIIYFFFRGRVGVNDPQGIEDVARSYIVLRPLPRGAKLGEGPLEDSGNARLLALPKKMLPRSKQDRFLMFVEKAHAHIKDLREQFASNDYATKTSG